MSVIVGNKKVRKVGVLTEPNTYDGNITPSDMQYGTIGYAQGEKVVGTGKAFEFATYGRRKFKAMLDDNGNEIYGVDFFGYSNSNLLVLTPYKGDMFILNNITIPTESQKAEIGRDITSDGVLCVLRNEDKIIIYSTEINDKESQFYYFIGKDNYL